MANTIKKIKLPRVDTPYDIVDANAVPNTRTVNGKQLNADITLSASDVGALPDTTTALKNPNALTFTGAVTGSYDGSAAKSVAIPTVPSALKNPNAITFTGGATGTYDGSSAVTITIPEASSGGASIVVSAAQPVSQNIRDFWYKIV